MSGVVPDVVIVLPSGGEQRAPVEGEVTLGREPGNTITIDDGYLSRHHCKISRRNGQLSILDMRSYNGTFVNGLRIHEECSLMPGDSIRIGRTTVYIDWKDANDGSVRVHVPDHADHAAVQPILKAKDPTLTPAYREVAENARRSAASPAGSAGPRAAPPTVPAALAAAPNDRTLQLTRPRGVDGPSSVVNGPSSVVNGPSSEDLRLKKTPVPRPAIEESALSRVDSTSSSGKRSPSATASRERDGLRVISHIARVLGAVEDEGEFLDLVLGKILEVVPAERGFLMRLDARRKSLYPGAVKSATPVRDDREARRLGVSHTISKKVIRERVSVLVDDAKIDARFKDSTSVQELEIRSILAAPIWLGEQVLGLIYLDHMLQAYMFTEADRELVVAVANLVALGLTKK